ncbi:sulfite exporter TauE/SafE family protein [Enterovirga rhinocerotis]|uniref:Probable membrane transporter protein n=1 Tax=Enterovirga rhinocerotis TaxID=1339210 RepID=A0A4R7C7A0_9HYPH|nr:sulfite exporter TauE/SafE family protein [Enterovirga rhinocerotis]TDR93852.1 hypothetical protein EV668_1121 [Enterovirga rhinocerotis]
MAFDAAFLAATIPAVILMGLAKGGFGGLGLLALPLMSLVMPPVQAAAIMLPLLIAQDVVSVWSFRREFDAWNLATLMPGALVGILAGYLLATMVSDAAVSLVIGLISLGFAIRRLTAGNKPKGPATKATVLGGTIWGAISGFTSMIAHAGGPPFQIYTMPQRLPPPVFVGTGALFFAAVNLAKLPAFIALGEMSSANLAIAAGLLPLAILATFAGIWLVRRIPPERFYTIIYWLLVAIGLKLIVDGSRVIWST